MGWRSLLLFVLLIVTVCFWSVAQAYSKMPEGKRPLPVKTGLFLDDILSINESTERMHYNATLVLQWKDPSLAFNKLVAGTSTKQYNTDASKVLLTKIWHPQIDLVGATGPRNVRKMELDVSNKGLITWIESFEATSDVALNLRQFPFDRQILTVSVEPFIGDASNVQLQLLPKYSGVSRVDHLQGWNLIGSVAHVRNVENVLYQKPFSRYTLYVQYKRMSIYYIYQILLPIVLIVFLSFSVFWMLDNPVVNRVAISLTAVLTIVVFQWRIQTKLPRVNYHTFSDIFMLISFTIAASTVVTSLILHHIASKKKSKRIASFCRVGYPGLYLVAIVVLATIFY